MSLKNALKTRLVNQFENANVKGADPLAPRNGYYFIKDVDYADIRERGKFPIAKVLWKSAKDQPFVKDVTFDVALSSLNLGEPLDYMNMVNKTIHIHDVQVVKLTDNSTRSWISCKYEVITETPSFTTLQTLVIASFADKSSTLVEAYSRFEKSLGIDLSEAIELEATTDDAYDAILDDEVYDAQIEDEVYDAPANNEK